MALEAPLTKILKSKKDEAEKSFLKRIIKMIK